jgi:hypothetical protein
VAQANIDAMHAQQAAQELESRFDRLEAMVKGAMLTAATAATRR